MKKNSMTKLLTLILCIVLIAALALGTAGCGNANTGEDSPLVTFTDGESLGQGDTKFTFTVVGVDGEEISAQISTNKTTVGEALMELGLIAGEQGDYGLYVLTVNGVTLRYETDGKYWAFYENGEYGMTGVDLTEIVPGTTYTFKAE